ncbi:hypothetical protein RyT2_23200 [Pseudolactococcus yaeyamensis]
MNKETLNQWIDSPLGYYGAIASIFIGVVLVAIGFYLKKKKKQWWILIVLLGAVSIVANLIQILR